MLGWEEIVQNYIIKYSNQIKKATEPLRDHFGIGYFTYHRIDRGGNYTVLVDRPDWAEHYVNSKIYLQDPYLRDPSVYQSGIALVDSHGTEAYKENVMHAGREVLSMDLAVLFIEKKKDSVEFFGFAGERNKCMLEKLYLNHPHILSLFAQHFKETMAPILNKMEEEASPLSQLKGRDYYCSSPIVSGLPSHSMQNFYRDIGLFSYLEKADRLSPRERQCLHLLLENKTAKESGAALGLSTRTIESYFETIKSKLGCWSKGEVFQIAQTLREMGFL